MRWCEAGLVSALVPHPTPGVSGSQGGAEPPPRFCIKDTEGGGAHEVGVVGLPLPHPRQS